MAIKQKTSSELAALVGTFGRSGAKFIGQGQSPYYDGRTNMDVALDLASVGDLLVFPDDANDTTIRIQAGEARIEGTLITYAGGAVNLVAFNNDTAYVWLTPGGSIGSGTDAAGWPTTPHMKLAEVTLASGEITTIVDRRKRSILQSLALPQYTIAISVQGDTGSPSTITITLKDGADVIGDADLLRVRVCDDEGYADATNATIAAGTDTTAVETISADKDIVFRSHTNGVFTIDLTDATPETVLLRIGPAPLGARRADYTPTLNVTHAAP